MEVVEIYNLNDLIAKDNKQINARKPDTSFFSSP